MTKPEVRPGCRVTLHYRVAIEDGFVVEDTFSGEPEQIVIGQGDVHSCIERKLEGLAAGDSASFVIEPAEGFGARYPDAVHRLPRSEFPGDMRLEPGQIIEFETPGGTATPGAVLAVEAGSVEVDFNHPLAGHTLHCEVEILEVGPAPEEGSRV